MLLVRDTASSLFHGFVLGACLTHGGCGRLLTTYPVVGVLSRDFALMFPQRSIGLIGGRVVPEVPIGVCRRAQAGIGAAPRLYAFGGGAGPSDCTAGIFRGALL